MKLTLADSSQVKNIFDLRTMTVTLTVCQENDSDYDIPFHYRLSWHDVNLSLLQWFYIEKKSLDIGPLTVT